LRKHANRVGEMRIYPEVVMPANILMGVRSEVVWIPAETFGNDGSDIRGVLEAGGLEYADLIVQ
jgi:hypothetical protein